MAGMPSLGFNAIMINRQIIDFEIEKYVLDGEVLYEIPVRNVERNEVTPRSCSSKTLRTGLQTPSSISYVLLTGFYLLLYFHALP
jgi:hypothetical protein